MSAARHAVAMRFTSGAARDKAMRDLQAKASMLGVRHDTIISADGIDGIVVDARDGVLAALFDVPAEDRVCPCGCGFNAGAAS